jgi:O-antigen/teichoic acid export membrane protein
MEARKKQMMSNSEPDRTKWRNKSEVRLRDRILSAGSWTLGAYSIEILAKLVSNLVLAQLLFPEAFGLVAASSSIIVGLALFSDFGIRAVIIQSARGESVDFLCSAWVFQILRGITLWIILVIICGLLSLPAVQKSFPEGSAFASSLFPILTIVLGLGLALSGFESTALILNLRKLQFMSVTIVEITSKIVTIPVTVLCAYEFRSVWALAAGTLTGSVVRLVLSHTVVPGPRMTWSWNRDHFHEIVQFGKWITVSSIASFFGSQSDVVILGLLLPSSGLGIYSIAKSLAGTAEGLLERINGSLTLSVLGEVLRNNPLELKNRYYRFRLPIEAVSALCGGMIFAMAPQIVGILYDNRYTAAGPMLRLLALGLAIYPFQLIRSAFTAIGQTYTVAAVSIIQAASLASFLSIGYLEFGPLGAIAGIAVSRLVPSAVFLILGYRQRWISVWHEARSIPIFAIGVVIGKILIEAGKVFGPEKFQRLFT